MQYRTIAFHINHSILTVVANLDLSECGMLKPGFVRERASYYRTNSADNPSPLRAN